MDEEDKADNKVKADVMKMRRMMKGTGTEGSNINTSKLYHFLFFLCLTKLHYL